MHLKHRLFNQKLAEPIVNSETGEIVAEEGTVLDRRKLDEIMDVLETNANSEVFELEGTVIDEPVEIQSIKVYVPNDEEGRTTTIIGNAFTRFRSEMYHTCRYYFFYELLLQLISWHWLHG